MDNSEYTALLDSVRKRLSENYTRAVGTFDARSEEEKLHFILRAAIRELTGREPGDGLVERLFNDTSGYGRLTPYLERTDIEEININSWNSVYIHYADGVTEHITDLFLSPSQSEDIVRKLLREHSGSLLDSTSSIAYAHMGASKRIAAVHSCLLEEGKGVGASIRFVRKSVMDRERMLSGTATEDMLFLLETLFRYGISLCISGKTSSGKTSTAGYLLNSLPPEARIITLEEVIREVELIECADGTVRNALQLTTRDSEDPSRRVTLADLFRASLRFDPSHIFVGEMRSEEAWNAQEASRSDHAVITTIHSKSACSAYLRMVTLAKQAYDFDDAFLLSLMTEAFPVIVYQKKLESGRRVLMEISECTGCVNGIPDIHTLYRFTVSSSGPTEGYFEKCYPLSHKLLNELRQNGCPDNILQKLNEGGDSVCLAQS